MEVALSAVAMGLYSLLLMAVLVLGAPYWLALMMGSGRYRAGLGQRLGRVPAALRAAVAERQVVWVHAVSVGEVLAATRLVAEFEAALGDGWVIVVSTTTATGQALARERFGAGNSAHKDSPDPGRVFYYPVDLAWAVRAYLRVLRPRMLVLMESELWPRMLVECGRAGVPVAVVNARVSDRSYARGVRVRAVWGWVLRRVDMFLAQSEEDGRRLVAMGARAEVVRAVGNLKYDVRAPNESRLPNLIREAALGRPILVAGSTASGFANGEPSEDELFLEVWKNLPQTKYEWSKWREVPPLLVLAPRHPERFQEVRGAAVAVAAESSASRMLQGTQTALGFGVITIDTIGDLAAVYGIADVAFVGGSLVPKGGHNPLEPAQFGVPIVMGPSFENFRDVVGKMQAADGIRIVKDKDELQAALVELLSDRESAKGMGERGRQVFEQQQGATARTVEALLGLVKR